MLEKEVVIIDHRTSEYGSRGRVIADDGDTVLVETDTCQIRVESTLVEVVNLS